MEYLGRPSLLTGKVEMIEIVRIVNSVFESNTYLAISRNCDLCFLIDCGDPAPIIENINNRGLPLKGIFITHSHFDHIYGLDSIIDEYPDLDLIGNARIDSVMYDLAPARTGRRGRPAKHGKRLCVETDFTFSKEKIGDYYTGVRRVFTKIFGDREVLASVTDTEKGNGTKRLFFSTIFSEDLKVFCTEEEHSSSDQTDHDPVNYIRCYYMPFDGRSKSATMNRKRSGLFATIWYGVARE